MTTSFCRDSFYKIFDDKAISKFDKNLLVDLAGIAGMLDYILSNESKNDYSSEITRESWEYFLKTLESVKD